MPYLSGAVDQATTTAVIEEEKEGGKRSTTMTVDEPQFKSFSAFEPRRDRASIDHSQTVTEMAVKVFGDGGEQMDAGESKSRPPSPPESGTTTPRSSSQPCPPRLRPLIPPPNYGTVEYRAIYRSSFPQDRNMDFMRSMKIRSVLTLVDTLPSPSFMQWMEQHNIKQTRIEIAPNKDGNIKTTPDSLSEALLFLLDSSNHPIYVHCNQGKHRTGCVVACLRRIQRVPIQDILQEYDAYASPKARDGDIELIRTFDPDSVFEYAKARGFFEGPSPVLKRLDSGITNIDALAEALSSGALADASAVIIDASESLSTTASNSSDGGLEMTVHGKAASCEAADDCLMQVDSRSPASDEVAALRDDAQQQPISVERSSNQPSRPTRTDTQPCRKRPLSISPELEPMDVSSGTPEIHAHLPDV